MTFEPSISDHLELQAVRLVESTIPGDTTIDAWRARPRPALRLVPECGHLHDTTTRYDHERKVLHFLEVCPDCGTERLVETQSYEPRFTRQAPPEGAPLGLRRAA
jgi:hypothetical protein